MVRTGRRKGLEEVYGSKMDPIHPVKPHNIPHSTTKTATLRAERNANGANSSRNNDQRTQRSYVTANDYFITTNLPLTSTNMRNVPMAVTAQQMPQTTSIHTSTQYGALSRRAAGGGAATGGGTGKSSARPATQTKSVYERPTEAVTMQSTATHNKKPKDQHNHNHGHGHAHQHNHAKLTQRVVYADNNNTFTDLSDKELMPPSNAYFGGGGGGGVGGGVAGGRRISHPPQHQLQQQQQSHRPATQHKHQHQHQHHSHSQISLKQQKEDEDDKDDKDDDPEEFFELISRTVKKAIGTSINDMLTRNFHDLGLKIERISNELKTTNSHLDTIQDHVTNKIVHYGEENSRHFRYLCMKSEYDKMFYQHHTMLAGKNSTEAMPSSVSLDNPKNNANSKSATGGGYNTKYSSKNLNQQKQQMNERRNKTSPKTSKNELSDCVKVQNPCACHSTSLAPHQNTDPQLSCSGQSVGAISSDLGVREVLGQIQRFCTQMQRNDGKSADSGIYNSKDMISNFEELIMKRGNAGMPTSSGNAIALSVNVNATNKVARTVPPMNKTMNTPADSMDDTELDDYQYTTDDTSQSDDSDDKYIPAATSARAAPIKQQKRIMNTGAGDAP